MLRRAGVEVARTEVRFQDLSIGATVLVGDRALPSIYNDLLNMVQVRLRRASMSSARHRAVHIAPVNAPVSTAAAALTVWRRCMQWPLTAVGVRFGGSRPFEILKHMSGTIQPVRSAALRHA